MSDKSEEKYDDVLPVSLMGNDLLDRHNDRIATFEPTFEIEDRERIINAVNSHMALLEAAKRMVELAAHNMNISPKAFAISDLRKAIAQSQGEKSE